MIRIVSQNLDSFKLSTPPELPDNKCNYCGEPSERDFCSKSCFVAEMKD